MDTFCSLVDVAAKFIEKLGFPIFIAIWVLIVQQKAMTKLTEAINTLTRAVNGDRLLSKFKKGGGE